METHVHNLVTTNEIKTQQRDGEYETYTEQVLSSQRHEHQF